MIRIKLCPCCGGRPAQAWPALIAPFIASYALQSVVAPCQLLECGACELRYFDGRFDSTEMNWLYSGYRSEAYFQARHHHEFWYTRRHNQGTGHAPAILSTRKSATEEFIRAHADPGRLNRVLDYGGDSGQFIPDGVGQDREVFDLSDALPVPGVKRIADEQSLELGAYDLVLLNHVLEHSPEPGKQLLRVAQLLKPGIGILHVEVPFERYHLGRSSQGNGQGRRLAFLARHPALLRWADFYSTLFRVALNRVPPFGFPKLHEHINFFSERSLRVACDVVGLQVVAFEIANRGHGKVLAVLARRT